MARSEISTASQFVDYIDARRVPEADGFLVERHVPKVFKLAYHHHASVEINFPVNCRLAYSFSGRDVVIPANRITIFWGASPHGVTRVDGDGHIVNVYVALAQILNWGLPREFGEAIISGAVLSAHTTGDTDVPTFERWAHDFDRNDVAWRQLIFGEIEMRVRRMALEAYEVNFSGSDQGTADLARASSSRYINDMLRFIADSYSSPIGVSDVADHVGLSESYAMALFRRTVGVPIKEYITRIRLSHAQMLLANTDLKILSVAMDSGFSSLSSFYETFQARTKKTPSIFRREVRR